MIENKNKSNKKQTKSNSISLDKNQFELLIKKIETMEKLFAINLIKDKSVKEQVEMLYSMGIPISEIGIILNKKTTDIGQYVYRKPKKNKQGNEDD